VTSCGRIGGYKFSRNLFPTRDYSLGVEMPERWNWPYQRPCYIAHTRVAAISLLSYGV